VRLSNKPKKQTKKKLRFAVFPIANGPQKIWLEFYRLVYEFHAPSGTWRFVRREFK